MQDTLERTVHAIVACIHYARHQAAVGMSQDTKQAILMSCSCSCYISKVHENLSDIVPVTSAAVLVLLFMRCTSKVCTAKHAQDGVEHLKH